VTAVEIVDEIKRLPSAEQAKVARMVGELRRPLTGAELTALGEKLAAETDPERKRILREELVAGFYGDQGNA
jgi:hypothetical protein